MPPPCRRRDNVTKLSDELDEALTKHLEAELERSVELIRGSYAPFDRYVRAEQSTIVAQGSELSSTLGELRKSLNDAS